MKISPLDRCAIDPLFYIPNWHDYQLHIYDMRYGN